MFGETFYIINLIIRQYYGKNLSLSMLKYSTGLNHISVRYIIVNETTTYRKYPRYNRIEI